MALRSAGRRRDKEYDRRSGRKISGGGRYLYCVSIEKIFDNLLFYGKIIKCFELSRTGQRADVVPFLDIIRYLHIFAGAA